MSDIAPIAMPGIHQRFWKFFEKQSIESNAQILDVGAGYGALTKKLHESGFNVSACDMSPEIFKYDLVECRKVDVTEPFPYPDNSFDIIIAIEVSEHILDHEMLFKESKRLLKPGGKFFITTPNILSLKSRIRFLFSGFFYSFRPLDMEKHDGMQHVASLTFDQYDYLGQKYGFKPLVLDIDKKQSTSFWLMIIFIPFLWLYTKMKKVSFVHNQAKLLLGRLLMMTFNKP